MNQETKQCQNCKKDFIIESDDFLFYEKMKVPPPTWCPECRFRRRLLFLNWISLYKRKCDSCSNDMISNINTQNTNRVFCSKCWWADKWDGTEYAMDYDDNRPFFEQLMELRNKSTFMCNESLYSSLVNSPYVNAAAYQKDCFMVFNADYGEKSAYCMVFAHINECLDGYRLKNCELCYECVGMYKSYRCIYSEELDSCTDVLFSRSCSGCTDCFGCINIRNKSYCIFNKQYSKEEYKNKILEMRLDTREGLDKAKKISRDFWMTKPRRSMVGNSLNVNVSGEFIYESKNVKDGYMISGAEDSRYVQMMTMPTTKNCYDYTNWGNNSENLYECLTVGEGSFGNKFCVQCWPNSMNNEYCMYAIQTKDCFGCVNLKRKQYCILNKQYGKEEYFKLKEKIIKNMKDIPYIDKTGKIYTYGELMPPEFSPYSYNETMAQFYFPLTKEEVASQKLSWFDNSPKDYNITMKITDLPDNLDSLDYGNLLSEIFECDECHSGYKFNELEIMLHKKIKVPLPNNCWRCRFKRRFDSVNGFHMYERVCDKCNTDIKTSYSPDRPEIIYCEKCYQNEVY